MLVMRDSRRQERSFIHKVKPLQPLHPRDVVWMKPHTNGQKEWKKAIVWRRLDERSYHVKVAGELYRQNRVDLKKTAEAPPLTSLIHQPYEVQSKVPLYKEEFLVREEWKLGTIDLNILFYSNTKSVKVCFLTWSYKRFYKHSMGCQKIKIWKKISSNSSLILFLIFV